MSNQIFNKNKNFPWQTIAGETIIIDPKSQSSFELNELGSFVWQRLDGENSVSNIHNALCDEYDVTPSQAESDLKELIDDLSSSNLIAPVLV